MRRLLASLAVVCVFATMPSAHAVTRAEVIFRAHAFAYHPWTCTSANLTGSCGGGYHSVYTVGDHMGIPYDWGGYMTLFEFDQQIAGGYAAGSYPDDGVLDCTAGVDCSGFVSQAWAVTYHQTDSIPDISTAISQSAILPGDVFNQAGYHVILYERTLAGGDPVFYESAGYNVHVNATGGWSYVSGYTPRRYTGITGTSVGNPPGTIDNPIPISTFPYTDTRDTSQSASDVLDGCGAAPTKNESGPEYIYRVTFSQPGTLTATITDDADTDIDIHLYTSMNTNDCIARHDSTISVTVDCGTYYLVADTFRSSGGTEYAGQYTLSATFAPSGGSCGSGPPTYDFVGAVGDPCAYPGHESLPFCNANLGSEVCIYSTSPPLSFCSVACTGPSDCAAFPGGCCGTVGSGERFCFISSLCGNIGDSGVIDAGIMPRDGGPQFDGPPTTSDGPMPDGGWPQNDAAPQRDGPAPDGGWPEDDAAAGDGGGGDGGGGDGGGDGSHAGRGAWSGGTGRGGSGGGAASGFTIQSGIFA